MSHATTEAGCLPVTVVIPAFNAAATLPRALASVFAQTRAPAEIVVVDDASQDHTWKVLQGYGKHRLPIRTLRLERNSGVAAARNAGWAMAREDYVAFLDADDAWHPRKLEIQYDWMIRHPQVALCGHRCEVIGMPMALIDFADDEIPVRRFGLGQFLLANRLSTPTVMLRRLLPERFMDGKRHSEDYLLWMQIVAAHGPAAFIDMPLAYLFKARYGATGLSGDMWRSQLGEIDTLTHLRHARVLGRATWGAAVVWSWLKFARRLLILVPSHRLRRRDSYHDAA